MTCQLCWLCLTGIPQWKNTIQLLLVAFDRDFLNAVFAFLPHCSTLLSCVFSRDYVQGEEKKRTVFKPSKNGEKLKNVV